jgi:hypothetical protein
MWARHADSLAEAIADDFGLAEPTDEISAYAHFVLQVQLLGNPNERPLDMLRAGFAMLEPGWAPIEARLASGSRP